MNNPELALNELSALCHKSNMRWWLDLSQPCAGCGGDGRVLVAGAGAWRLCHTCDGHGYPKLASRNVGELLMLCVSELAEAMEGHRKSLQDDKLPHRSMLEVELADCLIRIFDLAGGLNLDLGGAFSEKMAFNALRADHKIENRLAEGGKRY